MATDIKVFRDTETGLWVACLPPEEGYELVSSDGKSPIEALTALAEALEGDTGFHADSPDWWIGFEAEDEEPSEKADDEKDTCDHKCSNCDIQHCQNRAVALFGSDTHLRAEEEREEAAEREAGEE